MFSDFISQKLSSVIIENSVYGFVVLDFEFNTLYSNSTLEKITGFPLGELNKKSFHFLFKDEKYAKIFSDKLELCKKRSFDDLELKINKKSGHVINVLISGYKVEHKNSEYLVLIVQDTSSRRAMEKVLESSFDNFIQTTIDLDQAMKKITEQRTILELYKKTLEKELYVAKSVQKSIIPKDFYSDDYINVWGTTMPSAELGGDYFDTFHFDNTKLGVLITDVAGHGVPSALITTMIKVYFEKYSREFVEAETVFTHVNREVTRTLDGTGFYFTSFYSVIDLDTMLSNNACAGHDYSLCYNPDSGGIDELGKTEKGTIIGTFEDAEFDSSTYQLKKGSKILFFTDGITEARNKEGDFYGIERLKDFLIQNHKLEARVFIHKLIKSVEKFYNGAAPNDDRTVIVVDVKKIPEIKNLTKQKEREILDIAFRNGRKYIKCKQYSAAVQEFKKILKVDQNNSGAYSYLGQLFGIFGNFKKAEKLLNKSIALKPEYIQGYYFLGIILFKQKKFSQAKDCWVKLKDLAGDFKNVNTYIAKINKMGI